jgi:hypothetical protein
MYNDAWIRSASIGGKKANGFGRGVAELFALDMTQAGDYAIIKNARRSL